MGEHSGPVFYLSIFPNSQCDNVQHQVTFPSVDRVEWLNTLLEKIWPHFGRWLHQVFFALPSTFDGTLRWVGGLFAAAQVVKERGEPLVNNLLASLGLEKISQFKVRFQLNRILLWIELKFKN